MMMSIEDTRRGVMREFNNLARLLLTKSERYILYKVLKDYQRRHSVDRLVQGLRLVLASPEKWELIKYIRGLIAVSQVGEFDLLTRYQARTKRKRGRKAPRSVYSDHQSVSGSSSGERRKLKDVRVITIHRDPAETSLGFSVRGGSEHGLGIYVSEIDRGSVAEQSGLALGDKILEANNISFKTVASSSAVKVLTGSNRLKLVVQRSKKVPEWRLSKEKTSWFDVHERKIIPDEVEEPGVANFIRGLDVDVPERKVNLNFSKSDRTLGFNVRGGSEYGLGIYVSRVDSSGLAEKNGIKTGDQLIDVNGIPFDNITHAHAVEVLRGKRHLILTLRDVGRYPAYKELYAEYTWSEGLLMDQKVAGSSRILDTALDVCIESEDDYSHIGLGTRSDPSQLRAHSYSDMYSTVRRASGIPVQADIFLPHSEGDLAGHQNVLGHLSDDGSDSSINLDQWAQDICDSGNINTGYVSDSEVADIRNKKSTTEHAQDSESENEAEVRVSVSTENGRLQVNHDSSHVTRDETLIVTAKEKEDRGEDERIVITVTESSPTKTVENRNSNLQTMDENETIFTADTLVVDRTERLEHLRTETNSAKVVTVRENLTGLDEESDLGDDSDHSDVDISSDTDQGSGKEGDYELSPRQTPNLLDVPEDTSPYRRRPSVPYLIDSDEEAISQFTFGKFGEGMEALVTGFSVNEQMAEPDPVESDTVDLLYSKPSKVNRSFFPSQNMQNDLHMTNEHSNSDQSSTNTSSFLAEDKHDNNYRIPNTDHEIQVESLHRVNHSYLHHSNEDMDDEGSMNNYFGPETVEDLDLRLAGSPYGDHTQDELVEEDFVLYNLEQTISNLENRKANIGIFELDTLNSGDKSRDKHDKKQGESDSPQKKSTWQSLKNKIKGSLRLKSLKRTGLKKTDEAPQSSLSRKKGVFEHSFGSSLSHQNIIDGYSVAVLEDSARKMLAEDEASAVIRHIKTYHDSRDLERLVEVLLAILDKPEKLMLLRDIRGVVYPLDMVHFDKMVNKYEIEAYEKLSMKLHLPLKHRQQGKPRRTLMTAQIELDSDDDSSFTSSSGEGENGHFHIRPMDQYDREVSTQRQVIHIMQEEVQNRRREQQGTSQGTSFSPEWGDSEGDRSSMITISDLGSHASDENEKLKGAIVVYLSKNRPSLGLDLSGGSDVPSQPLLKIVNIRLGGAAADDDRIQPGLLVLSIDGHSVVGLTHTEAVAALQRSFNNKQRVTMKLVLKTDEAIEL